MAARASVQKAGPRKFNIIKIKNTDWKISVAEPVEPNLFETWSRNWNRNYLFNRLTVIPCSGKKQLGSGFRGLQIFGRIRIQLNEYRYEFETRSKRLPHTHLICSGVPPLVALVMAQAASFLVLNSALDWISIKTGKMLASITACKQQGTIWQLLWTDKHGC